MFLFIFESIGTSELMLVGIVALIFFGPRKLPEMAKKMGKIMSEFRGTANEFKETWQREVNFEEEAKAFDINDVESEPVARVESIGPAATTISAPEIKAADPASFEHLRPADTAPDTITDKPTAANDAAVLNDKQNWL